MGLGQAWIPRLDTKVSGSKLYGYGAWRRKTAGCGRVWRTFERKNTFGDSNGMNLQSAQKRRTSCCRVSNWALEGSHKSSQIKHNGSSTSILTSPKPAIIQQSNLVPRSSLHQHLDVPSKQPIHQPIRQQMHHLMPEPA